MNSIQNGYMCSFIEWIDNHLIIDRRMIIPCYLMVPCGPQMAPERPRLICSHVTQVR